AGPRGGQGNLPGPLSRVRLRGAGRQDQGGAAVDDGPALREGRAGPGRGLTKPSRCTTTSWREAMNLADIRALLDARWDDDLLPRLVDYVRVPAKSPMFDAGWAARGELGSVLDEARRWAEGLGIAGLTLEIVELPGRTPCLLFDAPATGGLGNERTVLFYGHLDKQPEMAGWREGFGPYVPI